MIHTEIKKKKNLSFCFAEHCFVMQHHQDRTITMWWFCCLGTEQPKTVQKKTIWKPRCHYFAALYSQFCPSAHLSLTTTKHRLTENGNLYHQSRQMHLFHKNKVRYPTSFMAFSVFINNTEITFYYFFTLTIYNVVYVAQDNCSSLSADQISHKVGQLCCSRKPSNGLQPAYSPICQAHQDSHHHHLSFLLCSIGHKLLAVHHAAFRSKFLLHQLQL